MFPCIAEPVIDKIDTAPHQGDGRDLLRSGRHGNWCWCGGFFSMETWQIGEWLNVPEVATNKGHHLKKLTMASSSWDHFVLQSLIPK